MPVKTGTPHLFVQQLVGVIQQCERDIAFYEWLDAEEHADTIASLQAKRTDAEAQLAEATAREKADLARSDRMRGSTVPSRRPPAHRMPRRRGAGRPKAQSARSSAKSGDSGSEDGEPEPHPEAPPRRLCAFCGRDIPPGRSPRATYCCDRHADRDRQRRKRQRDRERAVKPRIPTTADYRRMLELTPEDLAELLALSTCRCNGSHVEFEPGECFRCGHWLPRGVVA